MTFKKKTTRKLAPWETRHNGARVNRRPPASVEHIDQVAAYIRTTESLKKVSVYL